MGVELFLIPQELLPLKLHHFLLLVNLLFNPLAAIVVLIFQGLGFLLLETGDLNLEVVEVDKDAFEVGGFAVFLPCDCLFLLGLQFIVYLSEEGQRWVGDGFGRCSLLLCWVNLKGPLVMADFNGLCCFILAAVLLGEIDACDFLVGEDITSHDDVLDGNLVEYVHVVFVVLVDYESDVGA